MKTIYKYKLKHGRTELNMPVNTQILTTQIEGSDICLWALADPYVVYTRRYFDIYYTGQRLIDDPGIYIATVQLNGYTWHVFEVFVAD